MEGNLIKVSIVDDHTMFREGIKHILSNTTHIRVVGEYKNGSDFIAELNDSHAEVVLMDISMPEMNGYEATRLALEQKPELKVLVFSNMGNQEYYFKMVSAGAKGFILKETRGEELIVAIEKIADGETYFSQELLKNIIHHYNSTTKEIGNLKKEGLEFTKREIEVLQLLCKGMTNSEIADVLFLSSRTVEGHRANLLKKTDTKNTITLILFAIKNGILPL